MPRMPHPGNSSIAAIRTPHLCPTGRLSLNNSSMITITLYNHIQQSIKYWKLYLPRRIYVKINVVDKTNLDIFVKSLYAFWCTFFCPLQFTLYPTYPWLRMHKGQDWNDLQLHYCIFHFSFFMNKAVLLFDMHGQWRHDMTLFLVNRPLWYKNERMNKTAYFISCRISQTVFLFHKKRVYSLN